MYKGYYMNNNKSTIRGTGLDDPRNKKKILQTNTITQNEEQPNTSLP